MFLQNGPSETVVLLSDKKVDGHINIDLDVEKLESKGGTATYTEIKAFIKEKYGCKDTVTRRSFGSVFFSFRDW